MAEPAQKTNGTGAARRLFGVESTKLHVWWPLVRTGLEEIVRRTSPEWIPEDIYASLRQGEHTLLLGYEGELYIGFAIVGRRNSPFSGRPVMFVWAAYTQVPNRLGPFIEDLLQGAKSQGYKDVVFQSPRIGWQRLLKSHGFRLREYIFECKLGD